MATKGARPVQTFYQPTNAEQEIIPEGNELWENETFQVACYNKGAVVDISNMRNLQDINKENPRYSVRLEVSSSHEGNYLSFRGNTSIYMYNLDGVDAYQSPILIKMGGRLILDLITMHSGGVALKVVYASKEYRDTLGSYI